MLTILFQDVTTPPPNQCSAVVQSLYGPGDRCTNSVRTALSGIASFEEIFDPETVIPGCPQRVRAVLNYCSFIRFYLVSCISLSSKWTMQHFFRIYHLVIWLLWNLWDLKISVPKQQLLY